MCNLSKGILKDGIAIGEAKGRKDGIAIGEAKGRKDGIAIGEAKGRKDGIAIGQTKEKVKSIKSLMETLNCTAIHAMNLLKYSEEEQIRYLKLI